MGDGVPIRRNNERDNVFVLLQPAPSLDLKPTQCSTHTYIQMFKRTEELVEVLQKETEESIGEYFQLGKKMSASHLDRFQKFERLPPKQACLIFGGSSLRAADFRESEQKFVQTNLRLISGLYGVLRPYDDVKPVRDMPFTAKLKTKRGATILEFWSDTITRQVVKDLSAVCGSGSCLLVLCLAEDYIKALQKDLLPSSVQVVRCSFVGGSEDNAAQGRSAMAAYIVQKRPKSLEALKEFFDDAWTLDKKKSSEAEVVFTYSADPSDSDTGRGKTRKPKKRDKKEAADKKKSKKARARSSSGSASESSPPAKRKRSESGKAGKDRKDGKKKDDGRGQKKSSRRDSSADSRSAS